MLICTSIMNTNIKYIIILLFSTYQFIQSQSIASMMKSVKNYDYYHAKLYAYKTIKKKKKTSAAAYVLADVYYQNFQPFHNIDSADKYIHLSILNYPHKPYITKYGNIDSTNIYQLYDSITYQQFKINSHQDFPPFYDVFISHHPFMSKSLKEIIISHQNQKILNYTEKINKSDTTLKYITIYNTHPQLQKLHILLDNQIYNEMTSHHTAAEYLMFLRNYPKNINRNKALQSLLNIYLSEKNITTLRNYAREFSNDAYYSHQAWKWLFTYSVKRYNNEELEKFMQEYPDFPFKDDILEEIQMNEQILLPYTDTTGFIGFIDTSGQFKIPPVYDAVTPFKENLSLVSKNDSVFFINKKNQKIISQSFKDALPFYNGYAPVFDGHKWYFINRLGIKQSDNFDLITELSSDNNYVFKKNNLYGLCNYNGEVLIPAIYEKLGDFENHKTYYSENNLYGIIYDNGNQYPPEYQWISIFYNHIAIVKQKNFYGLIDDNNHTILAPEYDLIYHANKDLFIVVKNNKYGYFSALQKCFILDINFDFIKNLEYKYFCNDSLFKGIIKKKNYLIDKNGIKLNDKSFQDILIDKNFLLFKQNNKWAVIKKTNFNKLLFQYNSITICENRTLIAQENNHYIILDNQLNLLYQTTSPLKHISGNYYFEENENIGKIIDANGHVIIQDVDDYTVFEKYIIARRNSKIKVISIK